jgi:hypothetical protein
MLKRHFYYYLLKPYVPWRLRLAVRRLVTGMQRRKYRSIWPINQAAGVVPKAWPGWPNGKKFALVLTHDVEGPAGLAKCRRLAELEMALGFRSCFNFIPEGSYIVPDELRIWLTDHGFEVGVHDLKHDGKLYANEAQFRRHAGAINSYLSRWNAVGFRSGFMLHHREWLHELNVHYDASTFDTDPFEPQPDGVTTIFPFWVPTTPEQPPAKPVAGADPSPKPAPVGSTPRSGYVELPYTLPQDSTLFMLLEEKTGDIWRQKLDWVVSHHGMALINVHPDYLHLKAAVGGSAITVEERYGEWLRYINQTYAQTFWHVLPREMAAFVRQWHDQTEQGATHR